MRKIRLFSIAALALAMAACSSEENTLETQSPAANGTMHFTATIATPDNGAGTRTEYSEQADGTINVAWKQDDEIAIVNDVAPGTNYKMTVGTVNTTDGSATISGDITGNDGETVTAYYPYSAREEWTTFTGKFQSQDGTLKYIQDNLDYRIGNGTLSVSGTQATLKEALSMNSKIAILKLTLQDNAATPNALKATKVAVKNGDEVIAATATLGTATSTVYLGVLLTSNITGANITIEATVGSDTYTFSKTGLNLTAGQYYQSTVTMAPAVTTLDNTTTAWTTGSYVVPSGGLTYSDAITVSGDVTLTLTDGETLTLNKGISLAEGATLTVEGNGTMNVNGTNDNSSSTVAGSGMMCFKSGTLVATGGNGHVGNDLGQMGMNGGISHGGSAINGSLTLEGGNVTATGGNGGNAGGASSINWATGGNGGSAITGNVIINGGNWTANNGSNGTLLSGGSNNVAGTGGQAVGGTVTDNR